MTSRDLTGRVRAQLDALLPATARAHGEDPAAAGLLVALSGGPDSVALLHLATPWARATGRRLVAAHFNHRLRGEHADQDVAFCGDLCAQLEVPLVRGSGDPRALARHRGRGLEEAARHLRLRFLAEVRAAERLTAIATGHHRDDQTETVLMRVCRGTGLDGLRGLRARRGRLIRPLLGVSRAAILDHLEQRRIAWREDATNLDGSNVRSRLRRELLPLIADIFGSGAVLAPARLADLCEADADHLEKLGEVAWRSLTGGDPALPVDPHATSLPVDELLTLPVAIVRRVLRRWLQAVLPQDLELVHIEAIERWLREGQSGTGLDLPGPLRLTRDFDRVRVAQVPPPRADVAAWRVRVEPLAERPDPVPPPRRVGRSWRLIAAADGLQGDLQVRHLRPGDHMQPFGLAGHKKLSDLVREKRIPRDQRDGLLVVADRAGPLWVAGVAQAERTRVLPATRQTVTIILESRHEDLDS